MRKILAICTVAICLTAAQSYAATVNLWVEDDGGGAFSAYAQVSLGDNFGLSVYGLPLTATGGTAITSVDHLSPNTSFANGPNSTSGPAGFTTIRSADNALTLVGSQQLAPTPTDLLIGGFGQVASSYAALGITPLAPAEQPAWDAKLLLATGTYTGDFSGIGANTGSGDFAAAVFRDEDLTSSTSAEMVLFEAPDGVGNTAPTAALAIDGYLGGDTTYLSGTSMVTFDASGSSDDGQLQALSYLWDLDNDGQYDDADTGNTDSLTVNPIFWFTPGMHTVGVQVYDGEFMDEASAVLTVLPEPTAMMLLGLGLASVVGVRRRSAVDARHRAKFFRWEKSQMQRLAALRQDG